MNHRATPIIALTALVLLLAGCGTIIPFPKDAGTSDAIGNDEEVAVEDSTARVMLDPIHAYVFFDRRQKGTTPAPYKLRRSFGTSLVTLYTSLEKGSEHVRRFEVELAPTHDHVMQVYSFNSTTSGSRIAFDSADLSTRKNGNIVIPFFNNPIEIHDREYGLVLIVEN